MRWLSGVFLVTALFSCSEEEAAQTAQPVAVAKEPTTVVQTLLPKLPKLGELGAQNPAILPEGLASYPPELGELVVSPGEPHIARTPDGSAAPAPGANPRRLVRYVHLADMQLADDESPLRLSKFDASGPTGAALRPQDWQLCHMANAAVKTINTIHGINPIDFVLLGGDNADSAQANELDWVLGILNGGPVECDSGDNDDPVPGPDNDGKDPFTAEGLKMPWKWVTGNHDILVQGNVPVTEKRKKDVLASKAVGGTRDWKQGGALISDDVVADPRRALLDRAELMSRVGGNLDGHGIADAQKASGKAFHHFDVPNTPLRFVVLDTGAETGGAEGVLHQADVDAFVKPALDEAKAQGKWVVLASHHASGSLTLDGGAFGTKQDDALSVEAWRSFIGGYDNVIYSMVAHSHENRVESIAPAGGHGWWEVMTAAIADFPHQFRTVEIWDQDNGWLMLRATCVDLVTTSDPVAEAGRKAGLIDVQTIWNPSDGRGTAEQRNVDLYIRKPGG